MNTISQMLQLGPSLIVFCIRSITDRFYPKACDIVPYYEAPGVNIAIVVLSEIVHNVETAIATVFNLPSLMRALTVTARSPGLEVVKLFA